MSPSGRFIPNARKGRGRVMTSPRHRWTPRQLREVPLDQLLTDVLDPQKREPALVHLSKRRRNVPDFSLIVWRTPAIITVILQEILRIYPYIHHQEQMSDEDCHRASCAISFLHPVAIDGRVRSEFLRAALPQYLYPFLSTPRQSSSLEKLRLTSLGIIGSLVKEGDNEAIQFLLQSEIVPLCLCCMKVGTNLSKTTATFILKKILVTEIGLEYTCATQDRFFSINRMLASLFTLPGEIPSPRLLRLVVFCFYMISCNPRVAEILYTLLPAELKDGRYFRMFQGDLEILNCVSQLLYNTTGPPPMAYYGTPYPY